MRRTMILLIVTTVACNILFSSASSAGNKDNNLPANSPSILPSSTSPVPSQDTRVERRAERTQQNDDLYRAALAAGVRPNIDKATRLVNRRYNGPFKLFAGSGQYLGHGFGLTGRPAPGRPDQTVWVATPGQYGGLRGYWIYLPGANKCWQARDAHGPLRYWNEDGRATGNPEDWELFVFKPVDLSKGLVRVGNIYGSYIRYSGSGYSSDGNVNDASVFVVD